MSMFSMTSSSEESRRDGHALERVEVHAHEVDRLDLVLVERVDVLLARAHRQQAGVDARVERLDAAVEDLREARVVLDRPHLDARSASSRAVPPVETISTPSSASPRAKSTSPRLSDTLSSARRTRTSPAAAGSAPVVSASAIVDPHKSRVVTVHVDPPLREQPHRPRKQPVLDLVDPLLDLRDVPRIRRLRSPPARRLDQCPPPRRRGGRSPRRPSRRTRAPARSPGCPGKAGSSDGWTLRIRPAKRRMNGAAEDLHEAGQHHELDLVPLEPVAERAVARLAVDLVCGAANTAVSTPAAARALQARAPAAGWTPPPRSRSRRGRGPRRAAPGGSCPRPRSGPRSGTPSASGRHAGGGQHGVGPAGGLEPALADQLVDAREDVRPAHVRRAAVGGQAVVGVALDLLRARAVEDLGAGRAPDGRLGRRARRR